MKLLLVTTIAYYRLVTMAWLLVRLNLLGNNGLEITCALPLV